MIKDRLPLEVAKSTLCVLVAVKSAASSLHPNMIKDIDFAIEGNRAVIASFNKQEKTAR